MIILSSEPLAWKGPEYEGLLEGLDTLLNSRTIVRYWYPSLVHLLLIINLVLQQNTLVIIDKRHVQMISNDAKCGMVNKCAHQWRKEATETNLEDGWNVWHASVWSVFARRYVRPLEAHTHLLASLLAVASSEEVLKDNSTGSSGSAEGGFAPKNYMIN